MPFIDPDKPSGPVRFTYPSLYASLPAPLQPRAPGSHVTREELATVAPMDELPIALFPGGRGLPRAPKVVFGFPITPKQIEDICHRFDPSKPIKAMDADGYISTDAKTRVDSALTGMCAYGVHLSTVANHPDTNVVSFGDNYGFTALRETLKDEHIRTMQEILATNEPPMWYIQYRCNYERHRPDMVGDATRRGS
ncbi:hypothetical protein EWM64_g1627 [Hericium alpestre]|uniref:Uncharacterized protein n=1 Tax=Hericium alpestre TaxID=135208 RepID=A0A4Z0A5S7_9AGAM|nr:hypothetical protein EWM64_g1627 [Hericium alpestre]